jgi:membrane associated rhomboid family serine protease
MTDWPPPAPGAGPPSLRCYRHPKADAPVSCTRCDRPICSDCMISAPVGWQCPECVKGAPAVRRMRDIGPGGSLLGFKPIVTYVLIGMSVAGYLLQQADPMISSRYAISAFGIEAGYLEEIVTAGFLHVGIVHIAFNMLILFQLGSVLEERLGRFRFIGLYTAALLGGSIGELLIGDPRIPALGASGAVFGLMAATFVLPRRSRFGIEASVGGLLVINLVITFAIPGIAIGGHLGGLVIGGLVGLVYRLLGESADRTRIVASTAFALSVAVGLAALATPIAQWAIDTRL